jgi:hypothetical protein
MTHTVKTEDTRIKNQMDMLVTGELPEQQRLELLAWLDADFRRWRLCGLAFLEAQVWLEALGEPSSCHREPLSTGGAAAIGTRPPVGVPQNQARRWSTPLLVAAASIAAFVGGLMAQDVWRGSHQATPAIARPDVPLKTSPALGGPLVASVPVKGGPLGSISATLQFPVLPVDSSAGGTVSSVPDHVRRQWERRGYELVEERRYLPAKLPDGRQVMVPVNEVKMKFVGKPVS